MREHDYERFAKVVNAVMDVYGRERSGVALALWFKALQPFTLEQVEAGLSEHMRVSRFAPTPADVIAAITALDGRPTADEAWAMIPRSESESVFWTEEMAQAYGVASSLLSYGDQVGARRAFIDAYQSAVSKARAAGKPLKAWPSWGQDASGRQAALTQAVERGLLTREKAAQYVPLLPNGTVPELVLETAKRLSVTA